MATNWPLVVGFGCFWLGWQIVWVAPIPRQLRRSEVPAPKDSAEAYGLFWLDQYAWIGLGLLGGGLLSCVVGWLR